MRSGADANVAKQTTADLTINVPADYLTVQAALDSLPRVVLHAITILVTGDTTPFNIAGFFGSGSIIVQGEVRNHPAFAIDNPIRPIAAQGDGFLDVDASAEITTNLIGSPVEVTISGVVTRLFVLRVEKGVGAGGSDRIWTGPVKNWTALVLGGTLTFREYSEVSGTPVLASGVRVAGNHLTITVREFAVDGSAGGMSFAVAAFNNVAGSLQIRNVSGRKVTSTHFLSSGNFFFSTFESAFAGPYAADAATAQTLFSSSSDITCSLRGITAYKSTSGTPVFVSSAGRLFPSSITMDFCTVQGFCADDCRFIQFGAAASGDYGVFSGNSLRSAITVNRARFVGNFTSIRLDERSTSAFPGILLNNATIDWRGTHHSDPGVGFSTANAFVYFTDCAGTIYSAAFTAVHRWKQLFTFAQGVRLALGSGITCGNTDFVTAGVTVAGGAQVYTVQLLDFGAALDVDLEVLGPTFARDVGLSGAYPAVGLGSFETVSGTRFWRAF